MYTGFISLFDKLPAARRLITELSDQGTKDQRMVLKSFGGKVVKEL